MMKKMVFFWVPACIFSVSACRNPVMYSRYEVILPEIPSDWQTVLGKPVWQVEWIDAKGNWQRIDAEESRIFSLEIYNTGINPVIAYPYWPGRNIYPGFFSPAGALFPLDIRKDTVNLDWHGGADAQFYRFLSSFSGGGNRSPEQFDWQRFRSLLRKKIDDPEINANPWNIDWEKAAEKVINSGFRESYIVPRKYSDISVTIPEEGLWISPSPFIQGHYWETGAKTVLKATESVSRYVSAKGMIVYTDKTWAYFPRE